MHRFGLIGKTLKHSFSKNYFTDKFKKEGLTDYRYENFELPDISHFPELLRANPDLEGLNITIPYKEEILPFLNNAHEIVEKTGACNCIKIIDGQLHGFNTDVRGFCDSLKNHIKPQHKNALVLGTGGASKGICYGLQLLNISYTLVSRRKKINQLGYEDLGKKEMKEHQIIINTTPVGMYPSIDDDPPIPYRYIDQQHLLFDLIYNPPKTQFLKKGEEQGAIIVNGLEMLILQAEESWNIWMNKSIKESGT